MCQLECHEVRELGRLRSLGIGKRSRVEGPGAHMEPQGIPTMGGIMIVIGLFFVNTLFNSVGQGHHSILLPLFVILGSGLLGGAHDLLNLMGEERAGVTA